MPDSIRRRHGGEDVPYRHLISLSVDTPMPEATAVRVAGELSGTTGANLMRLLDSLLGHVSSAGGGRPRLIVDLSSVGSFERTGVDVLRHARHRADELGVGFQVTGIEGRRPLLPQRVEHALEELDTLPTLEDALTDPDQTHAE